MKAKAKAQQLVNKMNYKSNALKCVDEIIKSYERNIKKFHIDVIDVNPIQYWEEVIKNIKAIP